MVLGKKKVLVINEMDACSKVCMPSEAMYDRGGIRWAALAVSTSYHHGYDEGTCALDSSPTYNIHIP